MYGRRRAFGPSFALSISLLLASTLTFAQDEIPSHVDLPDENLAAALHDLADQRHCNISYEPSVVAGLRARAVRGQYTVSEALALLLRGTNLRVVHVNGDTFQILSVSTPNSKASTTIEASRRAVESARATDASNSPGPLADSIAPPLSALEASSTRRDSDQQGLEEIVVTGTNIRGVENKTAPLLAFDRADIDRSGYSTTEDFIDSLPQNVKSGANSADGILIGDGINNVENATSANLRGLGASSTLTLLNGHRVAPSSFGTGVDLSMIPLNAVERIEILTDGSSAIYGADAVGGVVNIILRKDFSGAESNARFDALSEGGGEQKQLGQSIGHTWSTGGALAVVQFQDANAIHSNQRAFTQGLPQPTDIYPSTKRYSGVMSAHQSLPASLEVFADVLAEHHNSFRAWNSGGDDAQIELFSARTNSTSANAGLAWHPFADWHVESDALFSQVDTLATETLSPATEESGGPLVERNLATIKEGDLKADGTLFNFAGAAIKSAAGASYRREDFSSLFINDSSNLATSRSVSAEYLEIYAPVVVPANSVTLVYKLELSAAARRDSYSDFGAKTSPRLGIFWAPDEEIGIRAAFSTSFRAPDPYENLSDQTANAIFIESGYPLPHGANGNVLFFGNQIIGPETSHNLSVGFDYRPGQKDTRLSLNYYRINYSNRIVNSPSSARDLFVSPQSYGPLIKQFATDAAVDAFVAGLQPPQMLYDFTSGGTGLAGVRYGFPYGYLNATRETTEGIDVGVHSVSGTINRGKLVADLNATYIRNIDTAFCGTCASTDLANTYGQPLKFRLRGALGWSDGLFSLNAAANFANRYADTNTFPIGRIGSFTTVDMNAGYRLPLTRATTVGLVVTNVFNSDPPRTAPALNGVAYDPNNADPRGRAISLAVRTQW